jgi:hypothetical protein
MLLWQRLICDIDALADDVCYCTSLKHISEIYRLTVCMHSGITLRQHQIDDWFLQLWF